LGQRYDQRASDSVLAGFGAFVFSTIVITLFGEIIPQAYFSRNALRMAARFTPLLNVYQAGLFLVAKPTAIVLNWWLGPEGITLLLCNERTKISLM
jgi:metal transporter CNNM